MIATYLPGLTDKRANLNKKDAEELRSQIIWWMRGMVRHPWHCLSFFSNVLKDTMVTVVVSMRETENSLAEVKNSFRRMKQVLETRSYVSFPWKETALSRYQMVIGELEYNLWDNIERGYQNTVSVLPFFFYFPENNILCAEHIRSHLTEHIWIGLTEEETLREAVKKGEGEKAKEIFRIIWDRCCAGGYPDPIQLKNSFKNVLEHMAFSVCSQITFVDDEKTNSWLVFSSRVEDYLEELAAERLSRIGLKSADIAAQLDSYLEEHFSEEIVLDDLAIYFGVTPAYCSKLIKDVTDDNFSKLLVRKRIKKAKEFLRETEMRIYEIAESTGYNDVKYFNRVFKKETGATPIQYRKAFENQGGIK